MKAFIIHTPHKQSLEYAGIALNTISGYKGWEAELFEGVSPSTLSYWEDKYRLKIKHRSRAADFYKQRNSSERAMNTYITKKCCALSHYRLLLKCAELSEAITILEHDVHCVSDWRNYNFEEVLILNVLSAIKQRALQHPGSPVYKRKLSIQQGISPLNLGLKYTHDPELRAQIMPGAAAYAITPGGANKLIAIFKEIGWEQNDYIVNSAYVNIQVVVPELFTFKLPNLNTSHGENMV